MKDALTILRAQPTGEFCCGTRERHEHSAAKKHFWDGDAWETVGYRCGALFDVYTREWETFDEFAALLQAVSQDHRSAIIRQQLKPGHSNRGVRRLFYERDGTPAPFEYADRAWICLDIDGRKTYQLPEWLQGVRHVEQQSSSAGVRPNTSVHLWFLLTRHVACQSLYEYFRRQPGIDASLFRPVQVHYTADPLFDGAKDPIEHRWKIIPGEERAEPPDVITNSAVHAKIEHARAKEQRRKAEKRRKHQSPSTVRGSRRAVTKSADAIMRATTGDRHSTIVSKAYFLGGLVASGRVDYTEARDTLIAAGEAVLDSRKRQLDVRRVVEDAMNSGMQRPLT